MDWRGGWQGKGDRRVFLRLKAVDRILLGEDSAGAKDKRAEGEMRNK